MLVDDYDSMMNQSWADLVEDEEKRKREAAIASARELEMPLEGDLAAEESPLGQHRRKGRIPQRYRRSLLLPLQEVGSQKVLVIQTTFLYFRLCLQQIAGSCLYINREVI